MSNLIEAAAINHADALPVEDPSDDPAYQRYIEQAVERALGFI